MTRWYEEDLSNDKGEAVSFDAEALRETDLALLVEVDGELGWIPKSQIFPESLVRSDGDVGELLIPEWLAEKVGFM